MKKIVSIQLQRLRREKQMCKYCERQKAYGWEQPPIEGVYDHNGYSGKLPDKIWWSIKLSDGTEINVYE